MSGPPLTCRRETYSEDPDATELNTVDIWTSGSSLGAGDDENIWVMFVFNDKPPSRRSLILNFK